MSRYFYIRSNYFFDLIAYCLGWFFFYGTSREPNLILTNNLYNNDSLPSFTPYYSIIGQTGIDVQGTFEHTIVKFEYIHRKSDIESLQAYVSGIEYSFYSISQSKIDIGIIAEYINDEREQILLNNELLIGARLSLNDLQNTRFLLLAGKDLETGSKFFSLESSSRLYSNFTINFNARAIIEPPQQDIAFTLEDDNFIEIEGKYYF